MNQRGDQSANRDIFNVEENNGIININNSAPPKLKRPPNENKLLDAVEAEVDYRLVNSIIKDNQLDLDKEVEPAQVKPLGDTKIKFAFKSTESLLNTSILEVFDRKDVIGKLLILGTPGVGKTTELLNLARSLIDRAKQNAEHPIPVLLELSSWKDSHQSMPAFLVEGLNSSYGVQRRLGNQWIKENKLLPLLDGLDEVKPENQVSCVRALNGLLQSESRPQYLVLCCRQEEYEKVIRGRWQYTDSLEKEIDNSQEEIRLHLNQAILLKPLTDEQIQQYLTRLGIGDLWQILQTDVAATNKNSANIEFNLLELMRTPLFLRIVVYISLNDKSERQKLLSVKISPQYLFDTYWHLSMARPLVERPLEDKGIMSRAYAKRKLPSKSLTRRWLVYLAQQLQRESQTEFLIERMQPSWLATSKQKRTYWLIELIILWLFFMPLNLGVFWLYLLLGIFIPLLAQWSSSSGIQYWRSIQLFESVSWSFEKAKKSFTCYAFIGLVLGLISWLIILIIVVLGSSGYRQGNGFENMMILVLRGVIFFGLPPSLIIGLIGAIVSGVIVLEIDTKKIPNQGIWKSIINGLIISFILLLISTLILGMTAWLMVGLFNGWQFPDLVSEPRKSLVGMLQLWLVVIFFTGSFNVFPHIALRLSLYRTGSIPWNYARFLDYCTERNLLQRVGGRYRFIHKLLQDHFAEMNVN